MLKSGPIMAGNKDKLEQAADAHLAICALLESTALSDQTKRQLANVKPLLELEISAMQDELSDQKSVGS